jgi:hypothetical protein
MLNSDEVEEEEEEEQQQQQHYVTHFILPFLKYL